MGWVGSWGERDGLAVRGHRPRSTLRLSFRLGGIYDTLSGPTPRDGFPCRGTGMTGEGGGASGLPLWGDVERHAPHSWQGLTVDTMVVEHIS